MREELALHVANRLTFGPRPGDAARLAARPLAAFLDEQLAAPAADDPETRRILGAARLPIEYEGGESDGRRYAGRKERRPLESLNKTVPELWPLADDRNPLAWEERVRPAMELRAVAILRAVHSRWQLRELLVDFWHNHFNVNAFADEKISAVFPAYDRDVIRARCFGNFRELLELVARSAPMGYYLNNVESRASPANENYARELFELHTLGAESYLNSLYNRWRDVPGAPEGRPIGYIDQDVYEAARAFTGWTIADGTDTGRGTILPQTGAFHYFDGWHDDYQKRVLAVELEPHGPPLRDGRRVLDLVASHPGTARHLCRKLCRRLVSDDPPAGLVERAASVWVDRRESPTQIADVVRAIVLSEDFQGSAGRKIRRPLELFAALARALEAEVQVNDDLIASLASMGQRLFEWPTPNGHPDTANAWLQPGAFLRRWNTLIALTGEGDGLGAVLSFDPRAGLPRATTRARAFEACARRLFGRAAGPSEEPARRWFLGDDPSATLEEGEEGGASLRALLGLLASAPAFQVR